MPQATYLRRAPASVFSDSKERGRSGWGCALLRSEGFDVHLLHGGTEVLLKPAAYIITIEALQP
jgi:hypothetical protein